MLAAWLTTAQTAAVTLNDYRLKKLTEEGNQKAASLLKLISNASRFTESVEAARLFCAFFYMLTCAMWLTRDVSDWFASWDAAALALILAVLIVCLLAGTLYLVFGLLFPKRFGGYYCDKIALGTVGFLKFFIVLFIPVCAVGRGLAALCARLCGVVEKGGEDQVTEEEIRLLVDVGREKGVIEASEKDMINHVFEFGDRVAAEVMTHRTELCAVEQEESIEEVLKTAVDGGHSKLPVYDENLDTIVGVLYVKDMLPYVGKEVPAGTNAGSLMRPPYFAPESIKLSELFSEMTARHLTMAVIVDEYGGTSGIVTTEDLLETIVGDMNDEYDSEDEQVTRKSDGTFEVDGSLPLSELEDLIGITFPEDDFDTVGGLLLSELGRIPSEGESVDLCINGVQFVIMQVQGRRIARVQVTPSGKSEQQAAADGNSSSQKE